MKDNVMHAEVRGKVKYKGMGSSSGDYKTGRLQVEPEREHWRCNIFVVTKRDGPLISFRLDQKAISNIIKKPDRVILDLDKGFNIYLIADATDVQNLKRVQEMLTSIKDGTADHGNESKAEVGGNKLSWSMSENSSPKSHSPDASPKFTSVKENKKTDNSYIVEPQLYGEDVFVLKENYHSGPAHSPEQFLKKGQEKSRETLKAFQTGDFYSSTPSSHKVFSKTSESSGSVKRPGLMPFNPTPQKRPRLLSDLNYSWGRQVNQDSKQQQQSLLGFSNLGNTCYMNAILQSLFGLNPFTNDLLNSFRKRGRSFSPNSLYCSLSKLLKIRKKAGCSDSSKRELLRNVKSAISGTAKRFSGYQQHDAHEFLCQVLDQLKEEIVKFNKSTPSPTRDPFESCDVVNATVDNFEFEVLHTITCMKCEEEVAKAEQFNDLSLDMPLRSYQGYPKSLQDSLDVFLQAEEIDYTCAKCGHSKSKVRHKFTRLPRILILHLKRYTYTTGISQQGKMGQRIFIPSYVSLVSHIDSEAQRPPAISCILTQPSPVKSQNEVDDFRGDISRKLDYNSNSKYTFKSFINKSSDDSTQQQTTDKDQSHSSDQDDSKIFPSFSLDDTNEEADMARAIELSLQEAQKQEQQHGVFEDGQRGEDDSDMKGMPEISQQPPDKLAVNGTFTESDLQQMSEEQRIEMAIQQSLMESQGPLSSFDTSSNSLSTSSIVKECSGAFLASRTDESEGISTDLPVIKSRNPEQTNQDDFDEVDGSIMAQIFSENEEDVFGSDIYSKSAATATHENKDIKSEALSKEEINYIFEDDSVPAKPDTAEKVKGKTEARETASEIDLTCSEEKENLKPEAKPLVNQESQTQLEPTKDEIMLIKQSRAENENGLMPFSYRLVSIVNHIGHSSTAGHYISDVYDMKKKAWLSFDDAHVSKMSETEIKVRRERSGYIFFYMCKEVFEELESLHTAVALTKS